MALEDKHNVADGLLKELSNSLFPAQQKRTLPLHKFWFLTAQCSHTKTFIIHPELSWREDSQPHWSHIDRYLIKSYLDGGYQKVDLRHSNGIESTWEKIRQGYAKDQFWECYFL